MSYEARTHIAAHVPLLHRLVPFARTAASCFFADFVDGRLWAVTPASLTARLRGDLPLRTGRTSETIGCGLINENLALLFRQQKDTGPARGSYYAVARTQRPSTPSHHPYRKNT
jgi:hypothetical protein